ncbi:MAG: tail fiber domain-containing protein [Bacteroidales bacterium]|jgi:hypothetical protein|nr:tail fiber domain-containing protein [Bacteroidales bacterium]
MKKIILLLSILLIINISFAQLKVASNGYVGIGVTPSTDMNTKLKIGNIWTFYDGPSDKEICRNARYNNGYFRLQTGVSSLVSFTGGGDILFQTAPYGSAGTAISNFNNVIIKNNGYVGIGTINPERKLQVAGEILIDATYTPNWGSGIKTKIYQQNACAYHLEYNGSDVFYVCGSGYMWSLKPSMIGSDIALKKNVKSIESPLEKIMKLQGVTYQYKDTREGDRESYMGFIAQDVEKIVPEVVKEMHDGTKAMSYTDLIALLVEATKEQQKRIEALESKLEYCGANNILKSSEVSATQEMYFSESGNTEMLKLYQNAPNPFNERTTVKCYVPKQFQKVQLCVYTMQGVQLQCITIIERGTVEVSIQAAALAAGIYRYVLLADSIASESKQMILTK